MQFQIILGKSVSCCNELRAQNPGTHVQTRLWNKEKKHMSIFLPSNIAAYFLLLLLLSLTLEINIKSTQERSGQLLVGCHVSLEAINQAFQENSKELI